MVATVRIVNPRKPSSRVVDIAHQLGEAIRADHPDFDPRLGLEKS